MKSFLIRIFVLQFKLQKIDDYINAFLNNVKVK